MILTDIEAVVFDCDGVLFDTTYANTAYYNHVLDHLKKPPLKDHQFTYIHMHTVDDSIRYLFPDEAEYQAAQAYRKKMSYFPFIRYMKMEPTLIPALEKLRNSKYKTAVATNRTDTMAHVLKHFDIENLFDLVVTALDAPPKPHPGMLKLVMKGFGGLTPQQVVYIGDSPVDAESAQAAGTRMIAFGNPDLDADYHITSFSELEHILPYSA